MAYAGKGQLVNRTTLADIFGVATNTIDAWVRAGCPVIQRGQRGKEWAFNTAQVRTWRENKIAEHAAGAAVADVAELKRRKLLAETTMAELELAKAKGAVALISEFELVQSRMMAAIQVNVMNVPQRAVLQLLGCTDETEFKTKLRAELVLALKSAAEAGITLDDEVDSAANDI